MRTVEFESADFAERFHVIVDKDAPDERVRRAVPSTRGVAGLVDQMTPGAGLRIEEYEYSCLCVWPACPGGGWAERDAHSAAAQGVADRVVEAGWGRGAPRLDRGQTRSVRLCVFRREIATITARSRSTQRSSGVSVDGVQPPQAGRRYPVRAGS